MRIAMIGARGLPETYSGVETFLKELCPRLVERGHEVTVYCRPSYFIDEMYQGVRLVRVPSLPTRVLDTMSHSLLSTVRALREKFDLVHFQAIGPASLSFIPEMFGLPTVATMHSLNWKHIKWSRVQRRLIKWLEYPAIRVPSRVVAVANEHRCYLEARYHREVAHIPNGVAVRAPVKTDRLQAYGLEPDTFLLYVGRLSSEKGCHYLVEAFSRLNATVKLVMAGTDSSGSFYGEILRKTADPRIVFLGQVPPDLLAELYSNALLYVLPSDSEGVSFSLLEAMSYGRCVLVSSIRENMDVVSGCGETFEAGDVGALLMKLEYLLKSDHVRTELGLKAKAHVQRLYNWDEITSRYEELYREAVRG